MITVKVSYDEFMESPLDYIGGINPTILPQSEIEAMVNGK